MKSRCNNITTALILAVTLLLTSPGLGTYAAAAHILGRNAKAPGLAASLPLGSNLGGMNTGSRMPQINLTSPNLSQTGRRLGPAPSVQLAQPVQLPPALPAAQVVAAPAAAPAATTLSSIQETVSNITAAPAASRTEESASLLGKLFDFGSTAVGSNAIPAGDTRYSARYQDSGLSRHTGVDSDSSSRLGLPQARNSGPSLGSRILSWVKELPTWAKIVSISALVVTVTVGGFMEYSRQANDFWHKSKSAADIVSIEKARSTGNASALESIALAARARQQRMLDRIAAAEGKNAKRVDDSTKDKVGAAKDYAAFDGMVGARAELNHNAVSPDAGKRIGVVTPPAWKQEVSALEAPAKESGFEGYLALKLQALRAETNKEDAKAARLEQDLKNFEKAVPSLFGGKLKDQLGKGQKDLAEFQTTEINPEKTLLTGTDNSMRNRVSDRLYSEGPEFRGHRNHRDRLVNLYDRSLGPTIKVAQNVDEDLREYISHRNSESNYLLLASMHTHDAVSCTHSYTDSNGNTRYQHSNDYEDNSGTYRMMAANEASSAQAHAAAANRGLEALRHLIANLQGSQTLAAEGLIELLPSPSEARH
ncbi:MAG: hypothetical protein WC881_10730, partial [Elusimicrobiota bacterium]